MASEIVVTGFPKCGTTALMDQFDLDPEIRILRSATGDLEVNWPHITQLAHLARFGTITAHKYTAYIYNKQAIAYLASVNPESTIVLCVRDPLKALLSWWHMHRAIARSGRNTTHFAFIERDFFADCTLDAYFDRWAGQRLRYHLYFTRLLAAVPAQRVVVVSQERMAQDMKSVAEFVKMVAIGAVARAPDPVTRPATLRTNADGVNELPTGATILQLETIWRRLITEVLASGVRHCLTAEQLRLHAATVAKRTKVERTLKAGQ